MAPFGWLRAMRVVATLGREARLGCKQGLRSHEGPRSLQVQAARRGGGLAGLLQLCKNGHNNNHDNRKIIIAKATVIIVTPIMTISSEFGRMGPEATAEAQIASRIMAPV